MRSTTRTLFIMATLALPVLVGGVAATPPAGSQGLVGTWRLVSYEDWDKAGKVSHFYGEHPSGYIVYDTTGHVFVNFMRIPPLPAFASGDEDTATQAEKQAAYDAYAAYFGTYTVDREHGIVVHHVEGSLNPMYTRTDQPRPFVLKGDTLILGDQKTWKRVLERVR